MVVLLRTAEFIGLRAIAYLSVSLAGGGLARRSLRWPTFHTEFRISTLIAAFLGASNQAKRA
ncbi:hypothetical protein SAMN05192583_2195 [Sphingomonas gellani]|uniref:Uncharacterized protein n=1 Tax=Sphingomonas gellani TaxID=1166340 RepID=A0A1H8EIU6_9SPHN|nr:hypothetical protein [Sphingomonas gellani]SEN19310.1 hypothetical protein SAMN05192583_2195 [Sphingomonas gellani]